MINQHAYFFIWGFALVGLMVLQAVNYLSFHVLAEAVPIALAVTFFFTSVKNSKIRQDSFYQILGCAFLCVAVIDTLHLLSYKGMGVFHVNEANVATQLWLIGRYVLAGGLLIGTLISPHRIRIELPLIIFGAASVLMIWLVFAGYFPDAYISSSGLTEFKIVSEYLIIACCIVTLLILGKNHAFFDFRDQVWLILAIFFTVLSEFSFTLYQDVYGLLNAAGHIFKLISYALFLGALTSQVANLELKPKDPV